MPREPRKAPIETIHGLRPPLAGFPYFANADRFPFEPGAIVDSPVNAWWLADASFLVYGSADFAEDALVRSPLPDQGFRLAWLGRPEDNRGLTLSNEASLIVVFPRDPDPRSQQFTSVLPETSHFRYVHRQDWVVDQPPEFLGYVHAGTSMPVPGAPPRRLRDGLLDGARDLTAALRTMAKEQRLKVGDLPFTVSGLADHMPVHYATHLWNALVTTVQAP